MSPLTGLARLPGRILWSVDMGNFSRVMGLHEPTASPSQPRVTSQPRVSGGSKTQVTGHGSRVTGHGSRVTGHRSWVTGHGSQATDNYFFTLMK